MKSARKKSGVSADAVRNALVKNLSWFKNSSIMSPSNGNWGVAERLFQVADPVFRQSVLASFNSWTDYGDWVVIESRRSDCNFQTALLFSLASEALGIRDDKTAENLLEYLYCRSGLLNRKYPETPAGVWNHHHTDWHPVLWLDDNAWCLAIPLILEATNPELAAKFPLRENATKLAFSLYEGFTRTMASDEYCLSPDCYDPLNIWQGRPKLPHWGSLCCLALALSVRAGIGTDEFPLCIKHYHQYLGSALDKLNVSEYAYALTGASAAAKILGDPFYLDLAEEFARRIISRMDPETGNIPSEHYEAPNGTALVDTIYTVNWALFGFQNLLAVSDRPEFSVAYEKLLNLIINIQDKSESTTFNGCWRGMYDMVAQNWGGGERREGGAGSTYSGWTNAPISIVLSSELLGKTVIG